MKRLAALGISLCLLAAFCVGAARLVADSATEARRERLVRTALALKGARYGLGAESPKAFDCSGFIRYVYLESEGIELPRHSSGQAQAGTPVELSEARPGDILAFGPRPGLTDHVAIYLGDGAMIHAASSGPQTGVIVSRLDEPWFRPRLLGARSILGRQPERP